MDSPGRGAYAANSREGAWTFDWPPAFPLLATSDDFHLATGVYIRTARDTAHAGSDGHAPAAAGVSECGAQPGPAGARELNTCTPALLSPSKGVGPLPGRQNSSSAGSANHIPTRLRSTRTRLPLTNVDENASSTIRWNSACPLPWASVPRSPMY